MPRKATQSGPETRSSPQPEPFSRLDTPRRSRPADDPVSLGLRKLWQNVEKEPVPDAFLALLDQIDAARATEQTDEAGGETGSPDRQP